MFRSEIVSQDEKTEKLILRISLISGILFVLLELFMAVFIKSQSILMDAAFDASELIVIVASLILTPFLYKPITEKHPFGYAQCESLFIIVKGFMLISVTVSLISNNIQVMLGGGSNINMNIVSLFEFILSILSFFVLLILKHYSKKLNSPMIEAEITGWKIDVVCGIGVSIAFLIPSFIVNTKLSWIAPYFDQIVAILLAISMLPEPIKMIIRSFREILLFAPSDSVVDDVREIVEPICEENHLEIIFIDVLQTGRKTWISITLKNNNQNWFVSELRMMNNSILSKLQEEFEDVTLELIPSLEE